MDTIYYNGKILTMTDSNIKEAQKNMPEALLVRSGYIASIGSKTAVLKEAGQEVKHVDLKGSCLMPSFIDPHSHFVMSGQMACCADLSECNSFDDILLSLQTYISTIKETTPQAVIGFGYDQNQLKEQAHPDKRILDKLNLNLPILILHISGHIACANSTALHMAGIDCNTPDPSGGKIGRIAGSTEPNGYLEEAGMLLVQKKFTSALKVDFSSILHNVQELYIKNGITTVQDGASTPNDIQALLAFSNCQQLKVDVVAYPLMSAGGIKIMKEYGKEYSAYKNHLKIGGYKVILDGSPQGRSAWMSEPYEGSDSSYCSYPWLTDETLEEYVKQALIEKRQLLAHCNGDAASEQLLNVYGKVCAQLGVEENFRPVMIHCQTVRDDQLDRMTKLHMIASFFVGHVWYWGDTHIKNFGSERGNRISPVKSALDRKVCITFHQDTPVTKPQMLHSVWCAVNRISRHGNIIGEDQKISVYEALKAITINGAYQYFEECEKGSLAIGKRADMVILNQCPLDINPMDLKNIQIVETIKAGETIYTS